ncbi:hypothetical protein NQZ68_014029 [Dissostichus eleginoides]|nr:hypothetical protein NQZ68_014025 [Dissostichus eleginoides]KAI9543098.1 hypothetical protein NQZ68_014029 [Dissostichus eleginoides]
MIKDFFVRLSSQGLLPKVKNELCNPDMVENSLSCGRVLGLLYRVISSHLPLNNMRVSTTYYNNATNLATNES